MCLLRKVLHLRSTEIRDRAAAVTAEREHSMGPVGSGISTYLEERAVIGRLVREDEIEDPCDELTCAVLVNEVSVESVGDDEAESVSVGRESLTQVLTEPLRNIRGCSPAIRTSELAGAAAGR